MSIKTTVILSRNVSVAETLHNYLNRTNDVHTSIWARVDAHVTACSLYQVHKPCCVPFGAGLLVLYNIHGPKLSLFYFPTYQGIQVRYNYLVRDTAWHGSNKNDAISIIKIEHLLAARAVYKIWLVNVHDHRTSTVNTRTFSPVVWTAGSVLPSSNLQITYERCWTM